MTRPVLVLGAEPRVVVTIARSLNRRGIPVHVASPVSDAPRVRSRAVASWSRLPSAEHEADAFVEALTQLVTGEGCDTLMPASDRALVGVSRHDVALRRLLHLSCPPPEIVRRVVNKLETLETARRCGIPAPETRRARSADELEALRTALCFPLVAKPGQKRGAGAFKVRYFQSFDALHRAFREDPGFGSETLLQEYCPGVGVGIAALMQAGEAIALFQHRRLKELPETGGVSVLAVSESLDPELVSASLALLRAIEWSGVAQVEYRVDRANGTFRLMEVNGRYWGSLSSCVRAGIDFPFYDWQLAHARTPDVPSSYPTGQRVRWGTGDLLRLHGVLAAGAGRGPDATSRGKELVGWGMDWLRPSRAALWSPGDPMPALAEATRGLVGLARADARALIRRLLPAPLLRHWRIAATLERPERRAYLRLRLARGLGLRGDRGRLRASDVRSVLFVCHGNIIRSPMAAALLGERLRGESISIRSAGVQARPGRPADERTTVAAGALGGALRDHRARPLTDDLVRDADAIFAMDAVNEARIVARHPGAARKVFLLGAFGGPPHPHAPEIPDPYKGALADVRRCYEALTRHVEALAELIARRGPSGPGSSS